MVITLQLVCPPNLITHVLDCLRTLFHHACSICVYSISLKLDSVTTLPVSNELDFKSEFQRVGSVIIDCLGDLIILVYQQNKYVTILLEASKCRCNSRT